VITRNCRVNLIRYNVVPLPFSSCTLPVHPPTRIRTTHANYNFQVFNVLFVLGACAFASKTILTLTAWPLARDCSYYSLTLIVLAIVYNFGPETPAGGGTIEWYEALIMLLLYIGYVSLMKFNAPLQASFAKYFGKTSAVAPDDAAENGDTATCDTKDDVNLHWIGFRSGACMYYIHTNTHTYMYTYICTYIYVYIYDTCTYVNV